MLRNELFCFQIACRCDEGVSVVPVISGGPENALSVRQVTLVPSELPAYPEPDMYYERTAPGLFPDPMLNIPSCGVPITGQSGWRSFFITIHSASGVPAGAYDLLISLRDAASGLEHARVSYVLHVLEKELPPQETLYTCWTYLDCIAEAHHVALWSEEFWTLAERYVAMAAEYGVNMMLTPLLTPPLETAIGQYRTTVQLVDVRLDNGEWDISFEKLDRYVEICLNAGMKKLEIAHLFSQWGARSAPQVVAQTETGLQRMFGWDTPSDDPRFTRFLTALLKAFKAHAQEKHYWEKCVFHVSDEPGWSDREAYERGKAIILEAIGPVEIMDALSDFSFYREGVVPTPVPAIDAIEPFARADVRPLWGYYCCCQTNLVSNRFFSMPLHRTRAMGLLMYVYDMQGFLHWGFNHYNAQQSQVRIDPFNCTDAIRAFPSGDAFSVYPAQDGPAPSLRLNAFAEGLQDERLLHLAEKKAGRENVLALIRSIYPAKISMTAYPRDGSFFADLRERLLKII